MMQSTTNNNSIGVDDANDVLSRSKEDDKRDVDKAETIIACHLAAVDNSKTNMMISRFDRWLTFYTNFVSKAGNQDKLLKLLQWSLYIASISVLEINHRNRGSNTNKTNHTGSSSTVNHVSLGLRKLYSEISMARYVIRLLGFPTALEAFRNNSWTIQSNHDNDESNISNNSNKMYYYWIGKVLAGSMVLYYPTELLAYVHWIAPQLFPPSLSSSPRTGNRWSYISCRFWVLYIVAELVQCMMQRKELYQKLFLNNENRKHCQNNNNNNNLSLLSSSSDDDKIVVVSTTGSSHDDPSINDDNNSFKNNNEESDEHDSLLSSYRNNQLQIYRNLLFILPCINWSLPNWDIEPWLNEKTNNLLMWFESIVCIHQAIMNQK